MDQETPIILDNFMPAAELVIISNGNFSFVPFNEIIRIIKKGHELAVITATKAYPCSQTMEEILRELPENQFARVQKSHIISLEHFELLKGTIQITRYFKKELNKKLGKMLEQQYRYFTFNSRGKELPK
jgi:DNA-binding LytR/AlgR family response regulator